MPLVVDRMESTAERHNNGTRTTTPTSGYVGNSLVLGNHVDLDCWTFSNVTSVPDQQAAVLDRCCCLNFCQKCLVNFFLNMASFDSWHLQIFYGRYRQESVRMNKRYFVVFQVSGKWKSLLVTVWEFFERRISRIGCDFDKCLWYSAVWCSFSLRVNVIYQVFRLTLTLMRSSLYIYYMSTGNCCYLRCLVKCLNIDVKPEDTNVQGEYNNTFCYSNEYMGEQFRAKAFLWNFTGTR